MQPSEERYVSFDLSGVTENQKFNMITSKDGSFTVDIYKSENLTVSEAIEFLKKKLMIFSYAVYSTS